MTTTKSSIKHPAEHITATAVRPASRQARPRFMTRNGATQHLIETQGITPLQAHHLLQIGAAGEGIDIVEAVTPGARARASRAWSLDEVVDLANLPAATEGDIAQIPGEFAVIVRQQPRREVELGDDDRANRSWLGVDLHAPDDEQRDASRMWWGLNRQRLNLVDSGIEQTGEIALLVSVGGLIVRGYSIIGTDDELMAEYDLGVAFRLAPGRPAWADAIERRWLPSGRGPALVMRPVWDLL